MSLSSAHNIIPAPDSPCTCTFCCESVEALFSKYVDVCVVIMKTRSHAAKYNGINHFQNRCWKWCDDVQWFLWCTIGLYYTYTKRICIRSEENVRWTERWLLTTAAMKNIHVSICDVRCRCWWISQDPDMKIPCRGSCPNIPLWVVFQIELDRCCDVSVKWSITFRLRVWEDSASEADRSNNFPRHGWKSTTIT